MRSLQLTLHRSWDQVGNFVLVQWDDLCYQDLCWWLDPDHLGEGVSVPDIPKPRLLVRRLGRGLGCSLGQGSRCRPLVSRGSLPVHQCQGALSGGEGFPPLSGTDLRVNSCGVRRQFHHSILSEEGKGHSLSDSELHCSRGFSGGRKISTLF